MADDREQAFGLPSTEVGLGLRPKNIGAPAAIANAVSDALMPLGAEVFELPMTPDRLFRLIGKAAG